MPEERQIAMTEYYCRRCRLVIFGDEISKIRHEESGARSAKKRKFCLWHWYCRMSLKDNSGVFNWIVLKTLDLMSLVLEFNLVQELIVYLF